MLRFNHVDKDMFSVNHHLMVGGIDGNYFPPAYLIKLCPSELVTGANGKQLSR